MSRFRRHRTTPGSAPGTLMAPQERRVEETFIRLIDYDADRIEELRVTETEALQQYLERQDSVTWINVNGLHDLDLLGATRRSFPSPSAGDRRTSSSPTSGPSWRITAGTTWYDRLPYAPVRPGGPARIGRAGQPFVLG